MRDMQSPLERMAAARVAVREGISACVSLFDGHRFYLSIQYLSQHLTECLGNFVSSNQPVRPGFNKSPGICAKVSIF